MTDYDNPWKDALDVFFVHAMERVYPEAYAEIDWPRGFEFLDTELQKVDPRAEHGKGVVDRLVKVWLKAGQEKWLLIHVEFQAQEMSGFPLRMFVYNVTLFLLYNQEVVSLAILGDERPNWRPGPYVTERWGCGHDFKYRTVKLLDWRPRMAELLASRNPIAHVIAAHVQALDTMTAMEDRRIRRFELVRNLRNLGLEKEFNRDVIELEKEERMPVVSQLEIWAQERGEKIGEERGEKKLARSSALAKDSKRLLLSASAKPANRSRPRRLRSRVLRSWRKF